MDEPVNLGQSFTFLLREIHETRIEQTRGFKPSALRPGRLTQDEIESLRKEFQQDGAWAEAELDRLEQEEAKSRKPTTSPT